MARAGVCRGRGAGVGWACRWVAQRLWWSGGYGEGGYRTVVGGGCARVRSPEGGKEKGALSLGVMSDVVLISAVRLLQLL